MDFTEIMNYLEQGFTLEQIKQMQEKDTQNQVQQTQDNNTPAQPAPPEQPAQPAQPEPPEWVTALNASITKLTHTIQANALSNTSINAPKDIQAQTDDILANIINPTYKQGG